MVVDPVVPVYTLFTHWVQLSLLLVYIHIYIYGWGKKKICDILGSYLQISNLQIRERPEENGKYNKITKA